MISAALPDPSQPSFVLSRPTGLRISVMRQHWMAIPSAVTCPLLVVAMVLADTNGWSNGALGSILLGLIGITVVVGTLMIPLDADGKLQRSSRRAGRRR
jgi:hypothetical protein